jgi:cytochrome c oxidase subunit I+III
MRLDVCPPPGARLPPWWLQAAAFALLAAGVAMVALARRRPPASGQGALCWLFGIAIALATGGFGLELAGQLDSGLNPASHAWSAAVAAMVAYQGLHVLLCAITGAYVIARSLCGHLTPHSRGSLDNTALIWYYTLLQGAVTGVAVHVWPRLMG